MPHIHVGDYRLIAKLGRGRYTEVFLALPRYTTDGGELVVVKRLRKELLRTLAPDEVVDPRPARHAALALRLHHPNIARTYAVSADSGSVFCVSEYLDGQPLDRVLSLAAGAGGFAHEIAVSVAYNVLSALEYAHALRDGAGYPLELRHADVRPHNVFVTASGDVKLLDFAMAELMRSRATSELPATGRLNYTAPEEVQGGPVDQRADLFAVGVMLWECLAQPSLLELDGLEAALREQPLPRLSALCPDIDPVLAAICDRAIERDPAERYPNAAAMRDALLPLLSSAASQQADLARLMQRLFEAEQRERAESIADLLAAERAPSTPLTLRPPAPPPPEPSEADEMSLALPQQEARASARPEAPKRRRFAALAALLGVCALALVVAWTRAASKPGPIAESKAPLTAAAKPAARPEIVLRLCGSNTVGAELAPALVEALLVDKGATDITRRPGADAVHTLIGAELAGKALGIEIAAEGSATAFTGLAAGSCDVGMASRAIDDAEVATLRERGYGDLRSPGNEHVIALDGIALIVHPNNPLIALNRAQLRDVFAGTIRDWSALGGAAGAIHVLARDDKSGTYDTFKHLVLGDGALVDGAQRFAENEALADAVAADPAAIGFVGLPYVRATKALAVGEPGTTPMLPSRFTVATEGYMLSRRLYLYTLPTPRTRFVTELVSFALSRRAQEVAAKSQFIDLGLTTHSERCDAHCPPRYAAAVAKAQRVSVDFRFRSGSQQPDSRADRDIDRLMIFLGELPRANVLLLGFADGVGNPSVNTRLSSERAKAIASALATRGIRTQLITGFGAAMPVASNATEAGRQRNRRVEVWLQ